MSKNKYPVFFSALTLVNYSRTALLGGVPPTSIMKSSAKHTSYALKSNLIAATSAPLLLHPFNLQLCCRVSE